MARRSYYFNVVPKHWHIVPRDLQTLQLWVAGPFQANFFRGRLHTQLLVLSVLQTRCADGFLSNVFADVDFALIEGISSNTNVFTAWIASLRNIEGYSDWSKGSKSFFEIYRILLYCPVTRNFQYSTIVPLGNCTSKGNWRDISRTQFIQAPWVSFCRIQPQSPGFWTVADAVVCSRNSCWPRWCRSNSLTFVLGGQALPQTCFANCWTAF